VASKGEAGPPERGEGHALCSAFHQGAGRGSRSGRRSRVLTGCCSSVQGNVAGLKHGACMRVVPRGGKDTSLRPCCRTLSQRDNPPTGGFHCRQGPPFVPARGALHFVRQTPGVLALAFTSPHDLCSAAACPGEDCFVQSRPLDRLFISFTAKHKGTASPCSS